MSEAHAAALGDEAGVRASKGEGAVYEAALARATGATKHHGAASAAECVHLAHASFIAQDHAHARAALEGLKDEQDPDARLAMRYASALLGKPLGEPSVRTRTPRAVFDGALIAAIEEELASGPKALEFARRVTRIARVEGDRDAITIAGIQLARVRRLRGFPYLARRILHKVGSAASERWKPWLAWEMTFAGERRVAPAGTEASRAVGALNEMLASGAWRGARPAWALWSRDLSRFESARDGRAGALDPWLRGGTHQVPFGLAGMSDAPAGEATAWVVGHESGARRLRVGEPPTPVLVGGSPRVDAALAVLMLNLDRPMEVPAFFRALYGFEYIAERHRSALGVLVHRIRQVLPPYAELVREKHVQLRISQTVTVLDPRTTPDPEDTLLAAIAERDKASARELADAMGLSVRTVQRTLRELAESGQCVVQGRGAATQYLVEDTTFTNPTGFGL